MGITKSTLADQRIVVYGAGSAGMGIARQIRDGMVLIDGLSVEEANKRFWCVDRNGLLVESVSLDFFLIPFISGRGLAR